MLTIKEVAEKLSVHPITVRKYIKKGLFGKAIKLNHRHVFRVTQKDIDEFMKRNS